jgi:LacI family transcriptional regulator
VVGYNDSPLTEHLDPALSTIRMPVDAMARAAARRVLGLIDGASFDHPVITLAPRLIPRASTSTVLR